MQLTRTRLGDDRGLTLTEVLISLVIMSAIMFPLGNALLGFMQNTDETTRRLSESHDIQIAAAYFAQDVQAMGTRDWGGYPFPVRQSMELDAPADAGLYPCGSAGDPNALVRFAWDDPQSVSGTPEVVRTSYVLVTGSSTRVLRRITCVGSATPVSDLALAHKVDTAVDPTISCSSSCTSATTLPLTVTLNLSIKDPTSTAPAIVIALVGQRRQT